MSFQQHSADLILKLYELRRDPEMRQARQWYSSEFRPASAQELLAMFVSGERPSANYRMVTSYWDMAAALVNDGAIDPQMFHHTGRECIGFFSLLEPHLKEFRELIQAPDYMDQWETLIRKTPGAVERMQDMRRLFMRWTKAPAAAASA